MLSLTLSSRIFAGRCVLKHVYPSTRVAYSKEIKSPFPAQSTGSPVFSKPNDVAASTVSIFPTVDKKRHVPSTNVVAPKTVKSSSKSNDIEWREIKWKASELPKLYLRLGKIRLTSLVVITSMGGYALAAAPFDPATFVFCSLGTGLVSCAANSINQFLEVPFDAQMSRTKNRVLIRGYLTPLHSLGFALASASTGLLLLYNGTNTLTTILGASNLVLYTMIYTPLKRISILNTWVGSVVGAIPPLMGWAACEGALGPGAWIMAGMLYAWQFPHFNALSWNLRPDYSRAGYRMMSVTDPGLCRRTALRYTAAITGLSIAAPMLDVTNWYFAGLSTPLNLYFMYLAYQFYKEADSNSSRKLFRFSLLHLPILMTMLLLTKKHWFIHKQEQEVSKTLDTEKSSQTVERLHSENIPLPTVSLLSVPIAR